jgi:hypothetical protein
VPTHMEGFCDDGYESYGCLETLHDRYSCEFAGEWIEDRSIYLKGYPVELSSYNAGFPL